MRRRPTGTFTGGLLALVPVAALVLVVVFTVRGRPPSFDTQLVVVEKGDSLVRIGERFGVRHEAIADLNQIEDPSRIFPDQVLLVPTGPGAVLPHTLKERVAALTQLPPGIKARHWRYIVIHHSASASDSARSMHDFHLNVRKWSNGLGYDFVIGNGSKTPDGFIEVGHRWARQLGGAHAASPGNRMNEIGIGICLVGNFNETEPTPAQMRSLVELVRRLQRDYHIPDRHVIGHRDVKDTDCPGRNFSIERLRALL
jgi:N-acetylmuramoyl-L-alanine amidase